MKKVINDNKINQPINESIKRNYIVAMKTLANEPFWNISSYLVICIAQLVNIASICSFDGQNA